MSSDRLPEGATPSNKISNQKIDGNTILVACTLYYGDATAVLNYIVGNVSDNFNVKAADVNGDGDVRIGDVTAVLNLIVNQ